MVRLLEARQPGGEVGHYSVAGVEPALRAEADKQHGRGGRTLCHHVKDIALQYSAIELQDKVMVIEILAMPISALARYSRLLLERTPSPSAGWSISAAPSASSDDHTNTTNTAVTGPQNEQTVPQLTGSRLEMYRKDPPSRAGDPQADDAGAGAAGDV